MTLVEFVKKYNGKKVDFDGVYGAQCVDLFRQYNKEVWGNPHTGAVQGAKDLYLKYEELPEEKKYLKRISDSNDYAIGDVIIFDATVTNKFGHVAIILGALEDAFILFEQDGFAQDGAKISVRTAYNVLGFLRKK